MTRLPDGEPVPRCRVGGGRLRLALQRLFVLARYDCDEPPQRPLPLSELALGAGTAGVVRVLLYQPAQLIPLAELRNVREIDQSHVALTLELTEFVEHERDTS